MHSLEIIQALNSGKGIKAIPDKAKARKEFFACLALAKKHGISLQDAINLRNSQ